MVARLDVYRKRNYRDYLSFIECFVRDKEDETTRVGEKKVMAKNYVYCLEL